MGEKREKTNLILDVNRSKSPHAPVPLIAADNQLLSGRLTLHASSSKESESTHQLVQTMPHVLKANLDKKLTGEAQTQSMLSTPCPQASPLLPHPPKGFPTAEWD